MPLAPTPRPPAAPPLGEHRTLLRGVGWDGYLALLEWFGDDGPRMTCALGNVEIMSPIAAEHEWWKSLLGVVVDLLAEELRMPVETFGSMTLKRDDIRRGVEPDDCFYFETAGRLRPVKQIHMEGDPPPDLCVEVEISNALLPRLPIYAAFGVPELWRFDGETLTFFLLDDAGTYQDSPQSRAFPGLPVTELQRFLLSYQFGDGLAWRRRFRTWIRDHLTPDDREGRQP